MSDAQKADRKAVHADPELLDYWRTLPAPSNERLAVEIIETLQRELQQWTKWGIVEISIRNQSVADYCTHWEGRAEKSERRLAQAQARVAELEREVFNKQKVIEWNLTHQTSLRPPVAGV